MAATTTIAMSPMANILSGDKIGEVSICVGDGEDEVEGVEVGVAIGECVGVGVVTGVGVGTEVGVGSRSWSRSRSWSWSGDEKSELELGN